MPQPPVSADSVSADSISPLPHWTTVEELCDRYLGGRPGRALLDQMKLAESANPAVREFVERVFRLMQLSGFSVRDICPNLAWGIGVMVPGSVEETWGGMRPSFTWPDRHGRIDQWLGNNPWHSPEHNPGPGSVLLEMGCGYPPGTAMDVARAFPDWKVIGADPCFAQYIVEDGTGRYACLDAGGEILYLSGWSFTMTQFFEMYRDQEDGRQHFSKLFAALRPELPPSVDGRPAVVEKDGAKLTGEPLLGWQMPNLELLKAGLGDEVPASDMIRCLNVLIFFSAAFREEVDRWALRTLRPDGLLICGADSARTTEAHYSVARREGDTLVYREFAFSIDNVRALSVKPWFTLYDGQSEILALAAAVRTLRSDAAFLEAYDRSMDDLLAHHNLLVRDAEGWLVLPPNPDPDADWVRDREAVLLGLEREGFAERAVEVLRKAGLRASVNAVGHVALDPADCGGAFPDSIKS